MHNPPFEQQLEDRLAQFESPARDGIIVPDLPLADFVIAVIVLALVSAALVWWAY